MMLAMVTNSTIIRIADQDLVEQDSRRARDCGIDEARHDRHLLGVESLGAFAGQRP